VATHPNPRDRDPGNYFALEEVRNPATGEIYAQRHARMCYGCFGSLFPHLVTLKVRKEHLLLAEVQRLCPDLESFFVEWDCPVEGGCSMHRPDMLWELPTFWFVIEVDESGDQHEDDRERLRAIARSMGEHRPGLVLRINPDSADRPFFSKRQSKGDGAYLYGETKHFHTCMEEVAEWIHTNVLGPWVDDPSMGVPDAVNPWRVVTVHKLFFHQQ
jgi:hypothetical protein